MTQLKVPVGPADHIEGDESARCTLVEYGDYECPHCAAAYPIVKRLQKHFGKKLRFVYRNFPLSQMHPHAESAAETAEFAASKGKFQEMHDLLFENQEQLGSGLYAKLAEDLGLDAKELQEALRAKMYQAHVRSDFTGGVRSGVNGTPTFFINGERYDDSFDYPTLMGAITAAIGESA
ncbi:MAG TPA: thioredoxin domain-containing protein [Acidobacteriaceae bacterium]|jgi:protein-disulfide isomerase|nr:thioredoxin domain-containing protein [Acidobacteriaceae bacterium]